MEDRELGLRKNCKKCSLKKEDLNIGIDDRDIEEYTDLANGYLTAKSAYNINIIPSQLSVSEISDFLFNCFEKSRQYRNLEMRWWKRIIRKYSVTENTKINTQKKCFYHCVNKDGQEEINFRML
jgi:hypothetical protein